MKKFFLLLFAATIISSCSKTPVGPGGGTVLPKASVVYVVNEGNFGKGNSTLTAYYPDSNKAVTDVFKLVNGRNLGDTGNDIAISNGKAYIVVNNSDKVEVVDPGSVLSLGTIYYKAGTSPYRIAIDPQDNRGFVSDLYTGTVSVINLVTNTLESDTITVGANPYGIAYVSGKVFVANSGFGAGRTVSVIDAASEKVVRTITVGDNPTEIVPDGYGNIWVVCQGNYNPDTPGKIFIVDLNTYTVSDSVYIGGHPGKIATDQQQNAAYLIADSSVIKLSLQSHQIMNRNFITGSYYGIAVDQATCQIYLTDPKDYVTNGVVYIYSDAGVYTTKMFTAGIIPDAMAFQR